MVREMLEELNTEYAKDTDNGDFNYFIITLPIKFFNEINLDNEIRRSVKFIDLLDIIQVNQIILFMNQL